MNAKLLDAATVGDQSDLATPGRGAPTFAVRRVHRRSGG